MNVLIIGGTQFVGRALTEVALARGHEVTLFHRGRTGVDLFPEVTRVQGDREHDLDRLDGRWDFVIDTCGYRPREVRSAIDHLRSRADRYVFVSTISVYEDFSVSDISENSPLAGWSGEPPEAVTGETYGPLKVLCEAEVARGYGDESLIIRPGIIVGPHDPTDRFTYWPWRIANGGKVAAPADPERRIQIIDAVDLARFAIEAMERGTSGIFNAVGPEEPIAFGALFEAMVEVSGSRPEFCWVEDDVLLEAEVGPLVEMPFWLPESHPKAAGLFRIDGSRARANGLRHRSVLETIRDTLEWAQGRPSDHSWRAGLTPERESTLLSL